MQGQRLPNETDWSHTLPSGAYWFAQGHWFIITPNHLFGDVTKHSVTEHEDGTITVSPSILVRRADGEEYHGFLVRGVWQDC